jgi:NTE family protein
MKVGLALSGGGARGFAHIGVLRVLVEHEIPIDMIAGSSAGSVVGGAFAAGMTTDEIETMSRHLKWRDLSGPSLSPRGLLSNAPMGKFIESRFPVHQFDELRTPFAAVACDLETGAAVPQDMGDLSFAIRASCAIPGIFAPLRDNRGKLLIDGGVVSPMPTGAVREMGADIVMAVDLLACGAAFRSQPRTALGVGIQSALMLLRSVSRFEHSLADVVIVPPIAHIRPDDLKMREELIRLGEEAARARVGEIKELIARASQAAP